MGGIRTLNSNLPLSLCWEPRVTLPYGIIEPLSTFLLYKMERGPSSDTEYYVFETAWKSMRQQRNVEVAVPVPLTLHFHQADRFATLRKLHGS